MSTRKRSRRGGGSVYLDKSKGLYVGQFSMGRDPGTGKRLRSPKVSAATETQCWELLDALREEYRSTGVAAPRNITVEHVIRDLLDSPPASWRSPITLKINGRLAERLIKAHGHKRLVKLTPGDVERHLASMVREGLATATISAAKGIGTQAVRRAQRDGLVGRNVFALAETPRGTRKQSKSMTVAQIRQLFASDLTPWWRAFIMTGILCGLRPGELLGLTWADVDFAAGVLRVRHSLKAFPTAEGGSELRLADLKTDRSRRTLALPAKAGEALRALKAVQAADKLRLGRYYTDQGLVFAGSSGKPRWRQSVNRQFKLVCERAEITADWTLHEQRHTFVSVLSDSGVDIELIADAAGHINSNVTRTVYRHAIADQVAGAATVMDSIFGKVSGS